jgi:outer membrane protein assembly factor BamB
LKAADGGLVWHNPAYGGQPVIANGVVYLDEGKIVMLNSSNGALLGVLSPPSSAASFDGSVIPVDGRVYVCSVGSTGVVSLDAFEP